MSWKASLNKTLIWLTVFSIAMGFLETAVVVYLRELYYPDGFGFPLNPIGKDIVAIEFFREMATVIMLVGVAILAGKNAIQRFAFFLFSFAIWDIFYYAFLYVLIGWPQSFMTWDVLFLIPIPWVGPVLSPLIITFLMIVHASLMVYFNTKNGRARINLKEWLILITGSLVVIISWTIDYGNHYTSNNPEKSIWSLYNEDKLFEASQNYVPQSFNWSLFMAGVMIISIAIVLYYLRNRNQCSVKSSLNQGSSTEQSKLIYNNE